MDFLFPKFRRNGNEMVHSIYSGVTNGGMTVTTTLKPSADMNRMETTRVYGKGLPRGQGGQIGVLVLGGMETTLDEMEYIIEAKKDKKFIPRRGPGEIVDMCRLLTDRRNDQIEKQKKIALGNPSMMPKKRTVRLHLPVGFRYVQTREPGLKVLASV